MTIADVLRDCRCVDPENCNEPVPGRKCRRASMHAVCSGCGNLTTGKDHVCIGDAPVRWYPCACGAEHDTPTCPFGAEHSLSPDVRRTEIGPVGDNYTVYQETCKACRGTGRRQEAQP